MSNQSRKNKLRRGQKKPGIHGIWHNLCAMYFMLVRADLWAAIGGVIGGLIVAGAGQLYCSVYGDPARWT